jgi:hypothetical protein
MSGASPGASWVAQLPASSLTCAGGSCSPVCVCGLGCCWLALWALLKRLEALYAWFLLMKRGLTLCATFCAAYSVAVAVKGLQRPPSLSTAQRRLHIAGTSHATLVWCNRCI